MAIDSSSSVSSPLECIPCVCAWAGTTVIIKSLQVADYMQELHEEELPAIIRAVQSRRETFSSGRRVARMAIKETGYPTCPLPAADDGSVQWPEELCGSISHTNDWAVAVIAARERGEVNSIGIDLERIKPMERGVKKLIATPAELELLERVDMPDWHAIALFSMKESIYKCLAKHSGGFIGFHDVEVTGLGSSERTIFRFCRSDLAGKYPASRLELRLSVSDLHVLTLAWLRA